MDSVSVPDRVVAAHELLAVQLDALMGGGVLLDPAALRRLRAAVDAALPVAEDYQRHLNTLVQPLEGAVA